MKTRKKFGGPKQTYKISKNYTDPEGKIVPRYNKRTMMKKAYQAFLKGKTYYTYKGERFVVPFIYDENETQNTNGEGTASKTML